MKWREILIILLIAFCWLEPVNADKLEDCNISAEFAATVMGLRQRNIDAAEVMKALQRFEDSDQMNMVITDAYSQPLFSSDVYKQRSVKKFKNKYFIGCYK